MSSVMNTNKSTDKDSLEFWIGERISNYIIKGIQPSKSMPNMSHKTTVCAECQCMDFRGATENTIIYFEPVVIIPTKARANKKQAEQCKACTIYARQNPELLKQIGSNVVDDKLAAEIRKDVPNFKEYKKTSMSREKKEFADTGVEIDYSPRKLKSGELICRDQTDEHGFCALHF